jgi:hypothetical protein
MRLTVEQSRQALAEHGCYVTEACDKDGKLLGYVRYTRRGEPGEWCSEICRDGSAAVQVRQARRIGRPRLRLSAEGRVSHRRTQIREATRRRRAVIKNGPQPTDGKSLTDAILRFGYTPTRTGIAPRLEALR